MNKLNRTKFRVWDKKRKEMSHAPNYLLSSDGLLFWQFGYEANLLEQDDFEVMFYTGRKDKNGKELFNGDIIRYTRTNWLSFGHPKHKTDIKNICLVYWNDKKHSFYIDMQDETGRVFSSGSLVFDDSRADENIIEIIGNNYENQELWRKSK